MNTNTFVLYHANCADGFGAAFAAWLLHGDSATYIPVQYGQPIPECVYQPEAIVYILDFSYSREALLDLEKKCAALLVLDHHATAEKELAGLTFAKFEKEKSGAVMAWEHFHPGKPVPKLLLYVQDRDLWKWELTGSRSISAYLETVERSFQAWHECLKNWDGGYLSMISCGMTLIIYQQFKISSLAKKAGRIQLVRGGFRMMTIPAVNSAHWQSELGEELLKLHPEAPAAAIYFQTESGQWVFSLRSREGGLDVSAIAKAYGGGGHAPAAGFNHSLPPCTQDVIDCLKFPHDDAILLLPPASQP